MKFYDSFLASLRQFFGAPEATEAEIDSQLTDLASNTTFAELMAGSGVTALTEQVQAITERLTATEGNVANLQNELNTSTAQIEALTNDLTAAQAANEAANVAIVAKEAELSEMKVAHDKQTATLAAQIAALKVGKNNERDTEDETHEAAKLKEQQANKPSAVVSGSRLASLVAKSN